MSLQNKVLALLVSVIGVVVALDFAGIRLAVLPSFEAIERDHAEESVTALLRKMERERSQLDRIADLVGHGVSSEQPNYAALFRDARVDMLFHAKLPDELMSLEARRSQRDHVAVPFLYYVCLDPETGEEIKLRDIPSGGLGHRHPFLRFWEKDNLERASGWDQLSTRDESRRYDALLATRRIGRNVVIVGRFLDDEMREAIAATATTTIRLESDFRSASSEMRAIKDELTSAASLTVVREAGDDELSVFAQIEPYRGGGDSVLLLEARFPRAFLAKVKGTVNFMFLGVVGASIAILLVLYRALSSLVIRPVTVLTKHAVKVGEEDDTEARTGIDRTDEIGQLASEFDRMMERLGDSRAQVVHASRLAGRSEIATGVLHNVGNVLNSVNVSTNIVRNQVDGLATKDLDMLVGVLKENASNLGEFVTSDPRGKHLVPFLEQIAAGLDEQRTRMSSEVSSLSEGVEHIAELVRGQQSFAITKGVFESAKLAKEVSAAVRMCEQAYGATEDVELIREFDSEIAAEVDKHKLMEILVNLIQNAKQAVRALPESERSVTLRVRIHNDRPRIEVADNGAGIHPDNLAKVFHHGFTTKPDGHGFGLHVSANAATEMNCKLFAESEGEGKGATFILEFPEIATAESRLAA